MSHVSCWCSNCKSNTQLIPAIEKKPCPKCGKTEYFLLASDDEGMLAICDAKAEIFMRKGLWEEAEHEYRSCSIMENAEFHLRMATLLFREDCARYIEKMLEKPVSLAKFRAIILNEYDQFVLNWILQFYRGIQLIPEGNSYNVARKQGS